MENCKAYTCKTEFSQNLIFRQHILLNAHAEYFGVSVPHSQNAENKINANIHKCIQNFWNNAKVKLCRQAKAQLNDSEQNDFPFNAYEAYLQYNLTYNRCCFFSYYYDDYTYTGGAHGTTLRKSVSFNTKNGRKLPLCAFFNDRNYIDKVIEIITLQADEDIAQNPGIYFDNYRELIRQNFNSQNFYLTDTGIAIYFQQYDIAPYSTGIVVFEVPYDQTDCPPTC